MNLTIEKLKFAKSIGATHVDTSENPDSSNSCFYRKDSHAYVHGEWERGWSPLFILDDSSCFAKIDFTPLDDYYADKAVDIAATSVPDGYYHDDEEDKLKPLKPESTALQYDPSDVAFKKAAPATEEPDMVNHPPHYQADGIECIDAIRASLGLDGFVAHCRGNAIKYSWRAGKKGQAAQDLRKAAWYLNRAADELEKQQ